MRPVIPILIISIFLAACSSTRQAGSGSGQPLTTVRVENRNFLDMKIYVLRGSERIRIGTVTGNSTQVLRIPEGVIVGSSLLQFIADPIGGNQTPISQEISVRPG
jgi:hypothetical protein